MSAAEAEKAVAPAMPIPNFSDLGKAANDVCMPQWQIILLMGMID